MKFNIASRQAQGGRDYQEDSYHILEQDQTKSDSVFLILADGMGGHVSGDQASQSSVDQISESLKKYTSQADITEYLGNALVDTNDLLARKIKDNPRLEGMGTTLVAVYINNFSMTWISVGDSPLWIFREGNLQRINKDHSMAAVFQSLVEKGEMTADEAESDNRRNMLRSSVMGDEIPLIDNPNKIFELKPNDRIIVASDGILTLEESGITSICKKVDSGDVESVVNLLMNAVIDVGKPNQDNTTIICCDVKADHMLASSSESFNESSENSNSIQEESKNSNSKSVKRLIFLVLFIASVLLFLISQ